jgi:hypothetical protein
MPEEGIETQELKEKLEEAAEHAHGEGKAEHGTVKWLLPLSLSTALIAVFAAVASLESGAYANEAIVEKNAAILNQSEADDAWGYYQAKGIKAAIYETQSQAIKAQSPELSAEWAAHSKKETSEQGEQQATARELMKKVKEADERSEHDLHVHHEFAKSVTIFQVAIALAAIAALTKKKPMWWVSMAVGAAGLAFFVLGFVPH